MRGGQIEQIGTPEAVYSQPHTEFVATFLGRSNLLSGIASSGSPQTQLGRLLLNAQVEGPVTVSVRPEHFAFTEDPQACPVTILSREFKGHDVTYVVQLAQGQKLLVHHAGDEVWHEGHQTFVRVTQPVSTVP
nr:TOBE domain-containing protein [Deinococcus betulae]